MSAASALSPAMSVSSFGAEQTTFGNGFRGRTILDSERYRDLDRRQSYYDCTQHDHKRFDFDGRIVSTGQGATQPLLSGEKASWYVPLKMRRPASPYRLGKIVVDSFTNLLFGEQRFPAFRVDGDEDTQDFIQAIVKASSLPVKMIRARGLGGAMGTVGLSWCFLNGKPRIEVHNSKNLFVHAWEDREQLIPEHVSEVYLFHKDEWDGQKKRFVRNFYWYRRDWTQNADILFKEVLYRPGQDPYWEPLMDRSVEHNDKLAHFVWIQNLPTDQEDGAPDYDGLFESFDMIDLIYSVITRGAVLNLDPTLKLKMDIDLVQRMGVKKGSDNALVVGEQGDAEYMEMSGTSIEAGLKLFDSMRRAALETAQCIVPDPSEVAAEGVSSVAIKAMFAPMLGKADILREQYGGGMVRILDPIVVVSRKASDSRIIVYDKEGNSEEGQLFIDLPKKVDKEPILDADGKPTGETKITRTDRMPGEGGDIDPRWPQYFPPTPDDQAKVATTLQLATGGKPFLSKQSAVEGFAAAFGIQPDEEWDRVQAQHDDEEQKTADMFADADGGMGGKVTHTKELPDGAKLKRTAGGAPPVPPGEDPDADKPPKPPKPPVAK